MSALRLRIILPSRVPLPSKQSNQKSRCRNMSIICQKMKLCLSGCSFRTGGQNLGGCPKLCRQPFMLISQVHHAVSCIRATPIASILNSSHLNYYSSLLLQWQLLQVESTSVDSTTSRTTYIFHKQRSFLLKFIRNACCLANLGTIQT